MSGLLRNLWAFLRAWPMRGGSAVNGTTSLWLLASPFDCGLRKLKSDKVFQFAEAAQIDYLVKIGRFFSLWKSRTGFVNLSQQAKFLAPIGMFSRVEVKTRIACADEKSACFEHILFVEGAPCAQVLVQMKFKRGRLTVNPSVALDTSVLGLHTEALTHPEPK